MKQLGIMLMLMMHTLGWAQVVEEPQVMERIEEVRLGQTYVMEEVLLPPKDVDHDYYPVLRVMRGGQTLVEITPEMLSGGMREDDCGELPCSEMSEGVEKRRCFGTCLRGVIQYFALAPDGWYVDVLMALDSGQNTNYRIFSVDIAPPHEVRTGTFDVISGSSVSRGVSSPNLNEDDPNYNDQWWFTACTVTERGGNGVRLEVVRPGFGPEGPAVVTAEMVGAPEGTTRVDFENLKWLSPKELEFEAVAYGSSASGEEVELSRSTRIFDVVAKAFVDSPATPAPRKAKGKKALARTRRPARQRNGSHSNNPAGIK